MTILDKAVLGFARSARATITPSSPGIWTSRHRVEVFDLQGLKGSASAGDARDDQAFGLQLGDQQQQLDR